MCSSSEAGSYLRCMRFVYHSTLGLRVIKKRRRNVQIYLVEWVVHVPLFVFLADRTADVLSLNSLSIFLLSP